MKIFSHQDLNYKNIIIIISLLVLFSCSSTKPRIETFYVDKGLMQYFVKPSSLEGEKAEILMDFTLRNGKDKKPIICNFTIEFEDNNFKRIKQATFKLENKKIIKLTDMFVLYKEISNNKIRYSANISLDDFLILTKSNTYTFIIQTSSNNNLTFIPSSEFIKNLNYMHSELIE